MFCLPVCVTQSGGGFYDNSSHLSGTATAGASRHLLTQQHRQLLDSTGGGGGGSRGAIGAASLSSSDSSGSQPVEFDHAITYVNKIKVLFKKHCVIIMFPSSLLCMQLEAQPMAK